MFCVSVKALFTSPVFKLICKNSSTLLTNPVSSSIASSCCFLSLIKRFFLFSAAIRSNAAPVAFQAVEKSAPPKSL